MLVIIQILLPLMPEEVCFLGVNLGVKKVNPLHTAV